MNLAWKIAIAGWVLNVTSIAAHEIWADKDPTHEDMVGCALLIFSVVPYFVFALTTGEIFSQRVLHWHHGNKYKKDEDPYV